MNLLSFCKQTEKALSAWYSTSRDDPEMSNLDSDELIEDFAGFLETWDGWEEEGD